MQHQRRPGGYRDRLYGPVDGPGGAGEQLLGSYGFVDIERLDVPFAWEFADPELCARALAATGPAYEAIQNVGEAEFHRAAVELARRQLRDGLPLRAEINVVGYLARKPESQPRCHDDEPGRCGPDAA